MHNRAKQIEKMERIVAGSLQSLLTRQKQFAQKIVNLQGHNDHNITFYDLSDHKVCSSETGQTRRYSPLVEYKLRFGEELELELDV